MPGRAPSNLSIPQFVGHQTQSTKSPQTLMNAHASYLSQKNFLPACKHTQLQMLAFVLTCKHTSTYLHAESATCLDSSRLHFLPCIVRDWQGEFSLTQILPFFKFSNYVPCFPLPVRLQIRGWETWFATAQYNTVTQISERLSQK
jgi:hypothetical protein